MTTSAGPFDYVHSVELFAQALGTDLATLDAARLLTISGDAYERRTVLIHGKNRILAIPRGVVKVIQGRVNDFLWPLSGSLYACCHGYVPGSSTLTNASAHCGRTWVQRLDIRDFYPSTHVSNVAGALIQWGASVTIANMIADLTTDKGTLPLGSPSSPIISNLILRPIDAALLAAADPLGLTYTRYADDLTFSGNAPFDVTIEVESALEPLGYRINPDKSQVRRRGQRILVTGLTVAESDRPRLPKQFKRRLRQEVYFVERFGLEQHCARRYEWPWIAEDNEERHVFHSRRHLQGKLHYAMGVEPRWTKQILASYPAAAVILFPPSSGEKDPRQIALINLAATIRARPAVPLSQQPRHL